MQVVALKSFVAVVNGASMPVRDGDVVEMPDGADWLRAGLVALMDAPFPAVEMAVDPMPNVEKAVSRKRRISQ